MRRERRRLALTPRSTTQASIPIDTAAMAADKQFRVRPGSLYWAQGVITSPLSATRRWRP